VRRKERGGQENEPKRTPDQNCSRRPSCHFLI
jgi:hypothetical protein